MQPPVPAPLPDISVLKEMRVKLRWSQKHLQRLTGVNQGIISRAEADKAPGLTYHNFRRLYNTMWLALNSEQSRALDVMVPIDQIFFIDQSMTGSSIAEQFRTRDINQAPVLLQPRSPNQPVYLDDVRGVLTARHLVGLVNHYGSLDLPLRLLLLDEVIWLPPLEPVQENTTLDRLISRGTQDMIMVHNDERRIVGIITGSDLLHLNPGVGGQG